MLPEKVADPHTMGVFIQVRLLTRSALISAVQVMGVTFITTTMVGNIESYLSVKPLDYNRFPIISYSTAIGVQSISRSGMLCHLCWLTRSLGRSPTKMASSLTSSAVLVA